MSDDMAMGFIVRDSLSEARSALKTARHAISQNSQVQLPLREAIDRVELVARRLNLNLYEVSE